MEEKLSGELVGVKGALENLIATINTERDNVKKASERFTMSNKNIPVVPVASESKSNTFDRRGGK